MVGPLLMSYLFGEFTRRGGPAYFPGAPFLLGAVLALSSVGLAVRSLRKHPPVAYQPAAAEALPAH